MLVVTNLQGQTEPLPDVNGVEDMEQVNGEYSLSFVCFNTENNQYAYPLVQEESTVELDGHEFRIKQMTEVRDRKEVHAQHIFFDLVDHYQEGTYGGTHTLDEFVTYALNGTGWTFENVDVTESAFIPNFGEGNVVALIRQICDAFGCEYQIMPGRHLRFMKQIGADKDEQFRYKHNIKTIKKSVDTTKLATAIKGYGANGLVVEYHSPNEAIYGTRWADPIKDDQYTTAESLTERLKQELVDVPEVTIELELSQLGFDVELGDRVWVIYEPLGIDFQTRVMEIKRYPFTKRSPVVTLSNKKRVFTDILTETKVDIEENKKETRSRIEQTNERITLEVERIDESIATLQIEADNIQLSVQSLDSRMSNAEATLTIHANEINQRVTYTDYNGNEIASRINQTATTIKIEASKVELSGYVTFTNLSTPGQTIIDGTNIKTGTLDAELLKGNRIIVGNYTGQTTKLEIWTGDNNAHYIKSNQAAGFRVESSGSLSLQAGSGYGVYVNNAPLVANAGLRVDYGTAQFNNDVTVNASLNASILYEYFERVATRTWVNNNFSPYYHNHDGRYLPFNPTSINSGSSSLAIYAGGSNIANFYSGQVNINGVCQAQDFIEVSTKRVKKNIEEYKGSALDEIAKTPVFFYQLKQQNDGKKRLGLLAESSPHDIVTTIKSNDGEEYQGINLYAMCAMMWKAIQELAQAKGVD
jgi:phage minor structural protein